MVALLLVVVVVELEVVATLLLGVVVDVPALLLVPVATLLVPVLLVPVLLVAEEPVEEAIAPDEATTPLERGTVLDNDTPLDSAMPLEVLTASLFIVEPELVPGSTSVVLGPQATSKATARGVKTRRYLFISGS